MKLWVVFDGKEFFAVFHTRGFAMRAASKLKDPRVECHRMNRPGIYQEIVMPKPIEEPEKMELWRERFGGMMTFICPILVLYGIAKLLGVLG